jgi:hypothetical protein
LQGVVLILSERLQQLTHMFDQCRAAGFKQALAPWEHASRLRVRCALQQSQGVSRVSATHAEDRQL